MTAIACVLSADEQNLFSLYGRYLNLERFIDGFDGVSPIEAEYYANWQAVGREICAAPATSMLCCQVKLESARKWHEFNVCGEPDLGDAVLFAAVAQLQVLMPLKPTEFDALCVVN